MVIEQHAPCTFCDTGRQLAGSLDYEVTLRSAARLAVPTLADGCIVEIVEENGSVRGVAAAHVDPAREQAYWELAQRTPLATGAGHDVQTVLLTSHSALVHDITDAQVVICERDAEHRRLLHQLGSASAMIVPLVARERTLGALILVAADASRRFGDAELAQAEQYAAHCALAIDNARLYRRAQAAIQVRDTFLAAVSHDLKNPLATIAAQAQLLRRVASREGGPLDARTSEGLARIEAVSARMAAMLDELLDVAQFEQGHQLKLERTHLDLAALVRRKASEHTVLTQRHLLRIAGEGELVGEWDAARLERVFDNLFGNAIKYSPDGGVITVVVVRDEDEEGAWAILSVRDEGMGIPAADLSRIFDHFQRARNVGQIGGTGLGLAVSRLIVEQHGGTIGVDSREGEGSTFTVRLPLSPCELV